MEKIETKKKKIPKKKIDREVRKLKISIGRSGSGSEDAKISIPISWIRDMKLSQEDREVEVLYSPRTKKISIKKWDSEETRTDKED